MNFSRRLPTFPLVIVAVALNLFASTARAAEANGLGSHITWQTLADGQALSKKNGKPLMLIVHKSWCPASKSLRAKFKDSKRISTLSKKFVMVNTVDGDEPTGAVYKPDGIYIPRILFYDPNGKLLSDVINENGIAKFKYYYYNEASIITSMEKVAALFSSKTDLFREALSLFF